MTITIKKACEILNVQPSASTAEIKRVYKKLAIKLHPDKNKNENTNEKFVTLKEAYKLPLEVASNIDSEKYYFSSTNFFPTKKPKKEDINFKQYGDWHTKYNGTHLDIYHPSLQGGKNSITFWNLNSDESTISLPINFNYMLHRKLTQLLIPIIPSDIHWFCSGDVEIGIKLPGERSVLNQILDGIFEIYQLPDALIADIKNHFGESPSYKKHRT